MKTVIKFTLVFTLLYVFCAETFAQQALKELAAENGVKIMYRWKALKDKKTKGLELCMEVNNTNTFPAEVIFSFAINRNKEQKSKSDEIRKCLKPNKIIRGRKKGLNFFIDEVTFTDVKSEKFELLINDIEVKQVTKCK